jgi:hypothetical protein
MVHGERDDREATCAGPVVAGDGGVEHTCVESSGPRCLRRTGSEARRGIKKRTNPTNQAPKWFSQAVMKAITTTDGEGDPEVAIAFPDYPRFRALIAQSEWALRRLRIGVYLVGEGGTVEQLLDQGG